jgi:tyrosyl-tRNA synthetase
MPRRKAAIKREVLPDPLFGSEEVTKFVHGDTALAEAMATTEKLFANQNAPAERLSVEDLEGMEGIVRIDFAKEKITPGIDIVSFLAETTIAPSKGEARKLVQGGGIHINRKKAGGIDTRIDPSFLLHNRYILVQKGKKSYFLINCN